MSSARATASSGSVTSPSLPGTTGMPKSRTIFLASILSPIVGTAYHAASPDAAPFVAIGDRVSAGQTVLVIEAMKTFNEIPSPSSGVVSQILFDNATPVEYGDVLMIIE